MTDYLQIMIECLEKKIHVLDQIIELDQRQFEISNHQPMDFEAYDKTMDEKGELIDELNKLDDGFNATYERVKDEVKAHPQQYKAQVEQLQELIRIAVEKGVTIEAQEQRNKSSMEVSLSMKRNEIKQLKRSRAAVTKYYDAMNRINKVDPQLMDHKN